MDYSRASVWGWIIWNARFVAETGFLWFSLVFLLVLCKSCFRVEGQVLNDTVISQNKIW